jgi:hypothetical protein
LRDKGRLSREFSWEEFSNIHKKYPGRRSRG